MSHIRQVGGVKKVKGTTIVREVRKTVLTVVGLITLAYYLRTHQTQASYFVNQVRGMWRGLVHRVLDQAHSLIGLAK